MKKLILITAFFISSGAYASCSNPQNSFESQKCLDSEVKSLKSKLNIVYKKIYAQTEAKQELDLAQKQWLKFKEFQCGDFVVADTQGSPATVVYDLTCQKILYEQRIEFFNKIFN